MNMHKTSGQRLVTVAKLVLVTVISLGLATTLRFNDANTLSLLHEAKALPAILVPKLIARTPEPLDLAINVLSPNDAIRYKAIFEAQKQEDWTRADALIPTLGDKRLIGHVLGDRYQRGQGTVDAWAAWLKTYTDYPEAETIYRQTIKKTDSKQKALLTAPRVPEMWGGSGGMIEFPSFAASVDENLLPSETTGLGFVQAINQALRRGNPGEARNLIQTARNTGSPAGAFVASAEAATAAGFFFIGEREEARRLADAAAAAQQPLGLWVRGLVAWEQGDYGKAAAVFSDLADLPVAGMAERTAAGFWAYRALSRSGRNKEAWQRLVTAAQGPRSFYQLLAAQLSGQEDDQPESAGESSDWNQAKRSVLAGDPTGWRALALVQVGETALAEEELRRLNPQKKPELREAMNALTHFGPMPALSLQLAGLTGEDKEPDVQAALHYPLLPWRPQSGFEVDRSLLYALARQESLFDPKAVSYRGARGLMQIMPATAARIMAGQGKNLAAANLSDPEVSLELGQKYVRHLAKQPMIGNNLLLVLAAYNGGPAKAARWMEAQKVREGKTTPDPLLFIESLPQRETRHYIQRVLPHYWAYRARLGESQTSLRQLAEGKWPRLPSVNDKLMRDAGNGNNLRKVARVAASAVE